MQCTIALVVVVVAESAGEFHRHHDDVSVDAVLSPVESPSATHNNVVVGQFCYQPSFS